MCARRIVTVEPRRGGVVPARSTVRQCDIKGGYAPGGDQKEAISIGRDLSGDRGPGRNRILPFRIPGEGIPGKTRDCGPDDFAEPPGMAGTLRAADRPGRA